MDPKERLKSLSDLLTAAMQGWQADLWTAMPGIIQSVDFVKQTCVVQVSIQISVRDITTGVSTWQSVSPLLDCPLFFPHGGNCSITFPVAAGDECLAVFASRCIDGWWQNGGVQPQALFRMHDFSDGFVFAGFRSNSKVVSGISSTKLQVRSADGTNVIELDPVGGQVNVLSTVKVNVTSPEIFLTGDVTIGGTLLVEGAAAAVGGLEVIGGTATDTLSVGGHPYTAHIHTGGTLTGGHTGPPV
jgi:Phage protein Gp138 N-terminal domain